MSEDLKPGTVIEGKGGKKYVYKGGDRKSRDSYTEFHPPVEHKSDLGHALDFTKDALSTARMLSPTGFLERGIEKFNDLVEEGAYEAGGKVVDATGSPALGYATDVAVQAVPSILSGSAVQKAATSILKPAGRFMMRSALKPQMSAAQNAKAVETLLNEGVNVSPAGAAALGAKVSDLSRQVDDIVSAADKAGVTISKADVARYGEEAIQAFTKQVTPQSDLSTIKKALNQFLNHPSLKGAEEIGIQLAQDLKKGTYKALGSKPYGETSGASDAVQKSLARGLKEQIEKAAPDVAPLNAKQSELLNALEPLSSRVEVAGRKNPMGIGSIAIESNPLAAAAFGLDRSELFKSILGRFLYSSAPSILRDTTRAGVATGMAATQ